MVVRPTPFNRYDVPLRAEVLVTRASRWARTALLGGVALAVGPAGASAFAPHQAAPPSIAFAQGMIQRQQFDSAVAVLTAEVEGQPELLPGWVLLGIAYHGKKDYAAALAANRKAVALAPSPVTPLYNGGLELGLLGQLDEAFEWMGRARSDGRLDMTALWNDPDAVPLRADPRFSSLQPTAEEYADPFVEPTTILREWVGEGARDQFGWVARDAGDVDGDGVRDVVTSAPTWGPNGSQAGKIYVYSSRTGALLWSQAGAPGEQLGLGIEAAGDVNADGVPDVIAGGPLAGAGRAVVYSGLDGRQLLEIKGAQAGEQFGRHVSDAGDIDGDGHDDILVTAPSHATSAGTQVGRVSIISGKDGSLLRAHQGEAPTHKFGDGAAAAVMNGHSLVVIGAPNAGPGGRGRVYVYRGLAEEPAFMIDADPSGAQLGGYFVSVVGDIDADGVPDVYASDFSDGGAFPGAGRIFVHSGADGSRLRVLSGTSQGEGFGIGPADAGDVDGDGHDDLVVGSWQYGSAAPSGGRATVHSGADGSVLRTITGQIPGETFGFDATGVGDVNGDGAIDYLLTSAWSSINGFQSGRMYIVSGAVPTGVPSGEEVIRAMHERYAESWYETLTFLQNTTNYDASGGVASVEKWYESIRLPGELRIDVAPVPDGRILLFRNDSLYTFQGGGQAQPGRPLVHGLLLMGFDIYHQPVEETLGKLAGLGVDVARSHATTWQGRPVWVVGAEEGDMTTHQYWIDQERLVFVRELNGTNEVQFNRYEPIGGGWIAPEVVISRNGVRSVLEEYTEMKVGMSFEAGVFDPVRLVRPGWIGGTP